MDRCSDSSTGRKYKPSMTYHFRFVQGYPSLYKRPIAAVAIKKIGNAKRRGIYTLSLHSRRFIRTHRLLLADLTFTRLEIDIPIKYHLMLNVLTRILSLLVSIFLPNIVSVSKRIHLIFFKKQLFIQFRRKL